MPMAHVFQGRGGSRAIVAVARKLLVALWCYHGLVPTGEVLAK